MHSMCVTRSLGKYNLPIPILDNNSESVTSILTFDANARVSEHGITLTALSFNNDFELR